MMGCLPTNLTVQLGRYVGAGPVTSAGSVHGLSLPKPALSRVEAGLPCPLWAQQAAPLRLTLSASQ